MVSVKTLLTIYLIYNFFGTIVQNNYVKFEIYYLHIVKQLFFKFLTLSREMSATFIKI